MVTEARPFDTTSFKLDLKEFAKAIDADFGTVKKRVAFDIYTKIQERSPVDKGTFRQSWYLTDADLDLGDVDPVEGKRKRTKAQKIRSTVAGNFRLAAGRSAPPSLSVISAPAENVRATFQDPYADLKIMNPMPYGPKLEFGHGSKQAPQGMVRITIAEVAAGIQADIRNV